MKKIHYYVYFSSNYYQYRVNALSFNKKSEIKNELFKNVKFYSTREKAEAVMDKLNADSKSRTNNKHNKFARMLQQIACQLSKYEQDNDLSNEQGIRESLHGLKYAIIGMEHNIADVEYYKNKLENKGTL